MTGITIGRRREWSAPVVGEIDYPAYRDREARLAHVMAGAKLSRLLDSATLSIKRFNEEVFEANPDHIWRDNFDVKLLELAELCRRVASELEARGHEQ